MTAPRTYRVIELFSGVGSQRMAFNIVSKQTGIQFEYVAQCDIDKTDFNVPQTRSRCFMVSRLGGIVPDFPKPIGLNHILGDYLEPNPNPKYYLSPRRVKSIIIASERNKAMGNGFQCFPVTKNDVARTITVKPDRKFSTHLLDIDEKSALKIKTNNSTGYMFGFPGDGLVLGQPQARGVVRPKLSPTLNTHPQGTGVITEDSKLRVLTPRESWRLMGLCQINPDGTFNDTNYELAAQHVSNSQLYKQAGNSIVVDVLVHLYLSFLSPSKVGQSTIDYW